MSSITGPAGAETASELPAILNRVGEGLGAYPYDHYRLYPAAAKDRWQAFALDRIAAAARESESELLWSEAGGGECLLALRIRAADEQRFEVRTAGFEILYQSGSTEALRDCLDRADAALAGRGVAFVQTRVNGDQLAPLHMLEQRGFRYYENILWPVTRCENADPDFEQHGAREMRADDVEAAVRIAEQNQFARGHFYCDPGFDKQVLDRFYGEWLRGAFERGQPIIVIEDEGRVAGYFALEMPEQVSAALGYTYGGMRSLGLDGRSRGKGLGIRIFRAAVSYLRSRGAEYIDSGYASKNHISARLHMLTGFASVYEEVTLHRWLKPA